MKADSSCRTSGFVLVTMGAVLWGTGGIAGSLVAAGGAMPWLVISALRLLGGGLLMVLLTACSGELRRVPRNRESARHIALTAVFAAAFSGLYFQAVALIGVAVATVLALGSAPLVVVIATAVRRRRSPDPRSALALVVALGGLILVGDVTGGAGGQQGTMLLGALLALSSGAAFAGLTIVNRKAVPGLSPGSLIATSFTLAGLLSLPWGFAVGFEFGSLTSTAWIALEYLAAVQTVLGYLAYYAGLHRGVPATSASILSLLEPLTASILAVLVLHETVGVTDAVGIALLLTAVLLVRPSPSGHDAHSIPGSGDGPEAEQSGATVTPAPGAAVAAVDRTCSRLSSGDERSGSIRRPSGAKSRATASASWRLMTLVYTGRRW